MHKLSQMNLLVEYALILFECQSIFGIDYFKLQNHIF